MVAKKLAHGAGNAPRLRGGIRLKTGCSLAGNPRRRGQRKRHEARSMAGRFGKHLKKRKPAKKQLAFPFFDFCHTIGQEWGLPAEGVGGKISLTRW